MNLDRYLQIRDKVLSTAKKVEDDKRMSYTAGDDNVLRNFLSDSEFVGTSQLQNCFTHFMKQVRGIASFVQHPDVKPSESLLSRASDLINYAVLMVANAEDSGRDTGLNDKKHVVLMEEGLLDAESWKKLMSKPHWSDPIFSSGFIEIKDGLNGYKPLHKDEILLVTQQHDYNFGKDDV